MFSLLARLRARFRRNKNERSRDIFRYWDGTRERGADPIKILRALIGDEKFNAEVHPDLALAGDIEAMAVTMDATRKVFGLSEYSDADGRDSGLTDGETLELLNRFGEYMESLKKSTSGPLTLPAATAPSVSEASTTKPASDSGSTWEEPKPAEPAECSMPSDQLSATP